MIEGISEENKEVLIKNIGKMYQDSMASIKSIQGVIKEENGIYINLRMKEKIDGVVGNLRLEYAIIIQREFLDGACENWFEKYFSVEEYNMYKKGAIAEFLHCLYG